LIRKQLHLAVEEELGSTEEEKELRKRLMDKVSILHLAFAELILQVLAASLQINSMEKELDSHKNHIRDLNKKLSNIKGTCSVHTEIVNDLTGFTTKSCALIQMYMLHVTCIFEYKNFNLLSLSFQPRKKRTFNE